MAGINPTKSKAKETADAEIEQKKSLEKGAEKDLKKFFNQVADDFSLFYAGTGKVLNLNEHYNTELNSLLKKNYRDMSKQFDTKTRKLIEQAINMDEYEPIEAEHKKINDAIGIAVWAYLIQRANFISPKIISTTQDVIQAKTEAVIADKIDKKLSYTQAQVANEVSIKIKEYGKEHSPIVATTETQNITETTKHIENIHINAIVETDVMQKGSTKVWITSGDEKVRKSHEAINYETIPYNQDFVTGMGSRMKFSGDMSLGASLSDVINCRCSTIYKYGTEFIKSVRNSIYRRKSKK